MGVQISTVYLWIHTHTHTPNCVQLFIFSACSLEQILSAHQSLVPCLLSFCHEESPLLLFLEVAQRIDPSPAVLFAARAVRERLGVFV